MDIKVRNKIFEEIKKKGKLDKDYVVKLIKTYDDLPDINKLVEQHFKKKADRLMSSFKDENGIRDCFAIKDSKNNTKYVDISKPILLTQTEINIVRDNQLKLKIKKEKVLRKVAVSEQVVTGQLKMEDYEKTVKEALEDYVG